MLATAHASTLPALPAARVPCRVVVRERNVAAFIARYRQHLDGDRIFILTRMPPAQGTQVRLQIHLATGECVLRGNGTVLRAVPEGATQAGGMEVRLTPLDEASRALVASLRNAPRGDGVPVVIIDDEKTIATGPPDFFTAPAAAPRRADRRTGAVPLDDAFDISDEIEYLVDWSDDEAPPTTMRPAPARRQPPAFMIAWQHAAATAVSHWRYFVVGAAGLAIGLAVGLVVGHC
jgi:hypothetical protein